MNKKKITEIQKNAAAVLRKLLGREEKKSQKKWVWAVFLIICLGIGMLISVFLYNKMEEKKENHLEVTFISPRQAIVFWKTDHETIGYVKYGPSKNNRHTTAYQTSSVPGETHAVVLDDVPLEGLFISIHNESDSPFLWEKPLEIQFDPTTIE